MRQGARKSAALKALIRDLIFAFAPFSRRMLCERCVAYAYERRLGEADLYLRALLQVDAVDEAHAPGL